MQVPSLLGHHRDHRILLDPQIIRAKLGKSLSEANTNNSFKKNANVNLANLRGLKDRFPPSIGSSHAKLNEMDCYANHAHVYERKKFNRDISKGANVEINKVMRTFIICALCCAESSPRAAEVVALFLDRVFIEQLKKMDCILTKECPSLHGEDRDLVLIWNAIKLTPVELHQNHFARMESVATLVMTVMFEGFLWTANVGDSTAIMLKGDEVVKLSEEAHLDKNNKRMFNSMLNRGFVLAAENAPLPQIRTVRFIGHTAFKGNNPRPKITRVSIEGIVFLASHTVSEIYSPNEILQYSKGKKVVEFVREIVGVTRKIENGKDSSFVAITKQLNSSL